MNLKHLTDKALLTDTKLLAKEYRTVTTKLLHHIKEIEGRRLFADLGYSSLFNYVVQELGFSEPSAARRIKAARLLNEIPEIEAKIESGDLNLSILGKAADAFRNEGIQSREFKKEVLTSLENTSIKTCEKTLSEIISPMREVPKISYTPINLSEKNLGLFTDLKCLLAHQNLTHDELVELILITAFNKLQRDKFHLNSIKELTESNTRYVPAAVKKAIFERDKACQNCGSKYALEFDHIKPYSLGGKTELKNLRLLCRSCNQRQRIKQKL